MAAMANEQLCALAQSGGETAKNPLAENSLGYIRQVANKLIAARREQCLSCGIDTDDLIQEGCIGLLKAVDLFDLEHGNKFLTYAAPSIRNMMLDLLRAGSAEYEQRAQGENGLGMTRVGLYDMVGDEETTQRIELISDVFAKTPEQIYMKAETRAELCHALGEISPRERVYLRYRFGFEDDVEHPVAETAEHFNLTVNSAKRTKKLALDNVWLELPWWLR